MRILIVEDEKRIQDFLSRGLESAGYAVDVAGAGNTALELVHATEYDLIILDLMLPDTDGLSVLEKVRNRKIQPPVLILSARDAVDDRVKGLGTRRRRLPHQTVRLLRRAAAQRACARSFATGPAHARAFAGKRFGFGLHPAKSNPRQREYRAGAQGIQHP